jgi:hypothetical protein
MTLILGIQSAVLLLGPFKVLKECFIGFASLGPQYSHILYKE